MNNHVNAVWKSVYYHIRALRHIRSSISENMAKTIVCAVVGSRLNYANSVLFGTTQKNISKLQKAQNLLARVVTRPPQSCSPRTLLQQLHWLPIKHRIDFNITVLKAKFTVLFIIVFGTLSLRKLHNEDDWTYVPADGQGGRRRDINLD